MTPLSPRVRLRNVRLYHRTARTRFPFRFGKASMTEMPLVYVRAAWEAPDGTGFEGVSASGIPPLWFDKRAGKTAADNERDLLESLHAAEAAYVAEGAASAWDLHRAVTPSVRAALSAAGQAPLAAGFGPALLEAALVDGLCRRAGTAFSPALKNGLLGVPADILAAIPARPSPRMALRHTVGLADALTAADVAAPLNDGLPETFEQVVDVYRPTYFKVKISGSRDESLERLRGIAAILANARAAGTLRDYSVTLDGNEQYDDMESFAGFLDAMRAEPSLDGFVDRILWIEQPVQRAAALDPAAAAALGRVSAWRPVIIDESDGEEDALERALSLGYSGVSSKTCKGLFRSVSHLARLARHAGTGAHPPILSCEDLTTVPVHPLQQDLCLAAALGLTHAERNGHHYLLPSGFLSSAEQNAAAEECPSLYTNGPGTGLRVRVTNGGFDLAEVNAAHGLGTARLPDWTVLNELTREGFPVTSSASTPR